MCVADFFKTFPVNELKAMKQIASDEEFEHSDLGPYLHLLHTSWFLKAWL